MWGGDKKSTLQYSVRLDIPWFLLRPATAVVCACSASRDFSLALLTKASQQSIGTDGCDLTRSKKTRNEHSRERAMVCVFVSIGKSHGAQGDKKLDTCGVQTRHQRYGTGVYTITPISTQSNKNN